MSLSPLDNLVRIGQLKAEPKNSAEIGRLLSLARVRLADAGLQGQSIEGRFISAYNAGHAAALAALRWHGYRSENRFTVFQCLAHTLGWSPLRWRILDAAHQKRNMAEYEGFLEIEEPIVTELCALVDDLIKEVGQLTSGDPARSVE
jgi:hypothetical protein